MKDGCLVGERKTTETSEQQLIKLMCGRDIGSTYDNLSRNDKLGDILLDVKHLETEYVHDVSFQLREGEVLGFAGLVGAGRTEVMQALFGVDKILGGTIHFNGKDVAFKSPREAIDCLLYTSRCV